jgi:hypothetical protein
MNAFRLAALALAVALATLSTPRALRAQSLASVRIQALIAGLDFDDARRALAAADADDPGIALERARLAIYEMDCDGAAATLGRSDVQKTDDGETLNDIAHGCQRVTAALASSVDKDRAIEVHWQDEHDAALAPLLFDTVAKARESLTRDLGVDWPKPTRIVVVRDLLSLSAMTGLPYSSAQTTGTVAVAKWGRVTLLSPRASQHGYPWRDTVAHELTHLAVTRATRDLAPLWLQEGVAKREEVRWRPPGPFDDRPPVDAVAQRGFEIGLALPLDRLGPSIAMLPSPDAAMVAFAEVSSFVRFYLEAERGAQGDRALAMLLAELRDGKGPDKALLAASGADLHGWDGRWRAYVLSRPKTALPGMLAGKDAHRAAPDANEPGAWRDLRERTRLAELLLERGHPHEARTELGPSEPGHVLGLHGESADEALADPSLRWLRASALEADGHADDAMPLLSDPHDVATSFGPWWAIRGRLLRARALASAADGDDAAGSFREAIAADPLDAEVACEAAGESAVPNAPNAPAPIPAPTALPAPGATGGPTAGAAVPPHAPTAAPTDPPTKALCDAARARAEPRFGGD